MTECNAPIISVIVPVFKAEKYLDRCVSSIRNQTYRNLEIVLVDDGSPDKSGEMCDEFQKLDNRIRVIHQSNQGVSTARNSGLNICTGEFITFVDSDDWLDTDILRKAIQCNSECVTWLRKVVAQTYTRSSCDTESEPVQFISKLGIDVLNNWYFSGSDKWDLCYITGKLFHRNIYNELRFRSGIYFEDIHLMPYWVLRTKNICRLECEGYYYNQHPDSIMHNSESEHQAQLYRDSFTIWQDHVALYHQRGFPLFENEVKKLMVDKVLMHSINHSVPSQYTEFSEKIVRTYVNDVVRMQKSLKGKIKYLLVQFAGVKLYAGIFRIKLIR